jgi:hypothetical protein
MKKAFTLIELLVVIAIIAILAAILFPVFAQAKVAAKKTTDLSNMKQMATATYMYYGDYDDTLFPYRVKVKSPFYDDPNVDGGSGACHPGQGSGNRQWWSVLLYPYIKSYDMFKGPGVANAWVNIEPNGAANGNCSYGGQNSYGVNRILFNANQNPYNFGSAAEPAQTLVITDTTYYDVMPKMTKRDATPAWPLGQFIGDPGATKYAVDNAGNCDYFNYWVQLGGSSCTAVNPLGNVAEETARMADVKKRNGGAMNAAFLDGHAKSYPAEQLVYDLVDKNDRSVWDPWKAGVQ